MCELACAIHKTGIANPLHARIRISKNEKTGVNQPITCRQCDPAPCAEACPEEAIIRDSETGALIIHEDRCIQCGNCVDVCPFGAAQFSLDGNVIICDLCGGDPMCTKFCQKRPENSSAFMANPSASALNYLEPFEASSLKREMQLRKAEERETNRK